MKREDHSEEPVNKLGNRIRARISELSPSLARVLELIDANRVDAMTKSAVELGRMIGTSDASVIRAVKTSGFDAFKELKQELAASLGHWHSAADNMVMTLTDVGNAPTLRSIGFWMITATAFKALTSAETRAQISAAVKLLSSVRRIGIFGLGSSSHLARYFALQTTRSGRTPRSTTRRRQTSPRPSPQPALTLRQTIAPRQRIPSLAVNADA